MEMIIRGEVLNLETGEHNRRSILVENNRIKAVKRHINGENIIDASDKFILPGFVDLHVHLMEDGFRVESKLDDPLSLYFYRATLNMRSTIEAGVTTVRDAGLADRGVKMAAEAGIIPSPRIQISVTPLSITGGHFDFHTPSGLNLERTYPGLPSGICDGVSSARKKTREVLRDGAEVVKVMATGGVMSSTDSPSDTQFTVQELAAIVEEASFRNRRVMVHAHGLEGIKNSLKAGVHSVEHGTYIVPALRASRGSIPISTRYSSSLRFSPCPITPESVPITILTPSAWAVSMFSLWTLATSMASLRLYSGSSSLWALLQLTLVTRNVGTR